MGRLREPRQEGAGPSSGAAARPLRVSAERLFELARHLTERDREVALYLYRHHKPGHGPTPADLAAVADQLEHVIAEGEPQKTKALLRLLIQELRVDGRAQIQPTYRLVTPEVCATSEKVEPAGIEPATFGVPRRRSPS